MSSRSEPSVSAFGRALRDWRRTRHMTQLELAFRANASQRHVSFLETGRSRPGADVVLRLGAALDLPLREQNRLLALAGLAPAFREVSLDDETSGPFRAAIAQILDEHHPFPAIVLDGWWDVVDINDGARRFFEAIGAQPANMIEALFSAGRMRAALTNWNAVATAVLHRLHREHDQSPFDERFARLVHLAETATAEARVAGTIPEDPMVVSPTFRIEDAEIRTFSVIAHFNAPRDVRLSELRVELLFPRDSASEANLARITGG